jgi:hypothetical protein
MSGIALELGPVCAFAGRFTRQGAMVWDVLKVWHSSAAFRRTM